ncbi:MAG: hypothetical protein K1X28_02205 [Parachlamydiales bacterium]|nr:hypothetical protein [Parachlamydiales bacterium]
MTQPVDANSPLFQVLKTFDGIRGELTYQPENAHDHDLRVSPDDVCTDTRQPTVWLNTQAAKNIRDINFLGATTPKERAALRKQAEAAIKKIEGIRKKFQQDIQKIEAVKVQNRTREETSKHRQLLKNLELVQRDEAIAKAFVENPTLPGLAEPLNCVQKAASVALKLLPWAIAAASVAYVAFYK